MKSLKKLFMAFAALIPGTSFAIAPVVVGGIAALGGIIGVSIWRTAAPVNMQDALDFFTSCWTCQLFSDVMLAMSNLLPGVYKALGVVIIPMSLALLAVLIAWRLFSNMINGKFEEPSKLLGNFGSYMVKLTILTGLLFMPLPRLITNVLIEPAVTLGTSLDYMVTDNDAFSDCMIVTAVSDPTTVTSDAAQRGAFSPKLRHQLACEIANVHQLTGLGMTVGWAMMGAAFEYKYQHKVLAKIPIFPNVPLFAVGLLLLVLYIYALLPIPLYFLEIFIKLAMDLIMLPFMLMAWMFDDENFALFPKGGRTIREMINDLIKGVVGIALTIVFLTFSVMFINAMFGSWTGDNVLQTAIEKNDSQYLIDSLMLQNNSLITIILMGIFIAMFMTMIPQLTSMLFKIKISDKYYQTVKKDLSIVFKKVGNLIPGNKKADSAGGANSSSDGGGSSGGNSLWNSSSHNSENSKRTHIEYIESTGVQYIDTDVCPDDDTIIIMEIQINHDQNPSADKFLFGVRDAQNQNNSFGVAVFHNGNPGEIYAEYGSANASGDIGYPIYGNKIIVQVSAGNLNNDDKTAHVSVDTKTIITKLVTQPFNISWPIFLFGLNTNNVVSCETAYRLYRFSIMKSHGSAVRLFDPVLDEKGTPCLYDKVTHKLYYNKGRGNFIAGPKKQ